MIIIMPILKNVMSQKKIAEKETTQSAMLQWTVHGFMLMQVCQKGTRVRIGVL